MKRLGQNQWRQFFKMVKDRATTIKQQRQRANQPADVCAMYSPSIGRNNIAANGHRYTPSVVPIRKVNVALNSSMWAGWNTGKINGLIGWVLYHLGFQYEGH